jgi:hypothetical protein
MLKKSLEAVLNINFKKALSVKCGLKLPILLVSKTDTEFYLS